jgi:hypothetical protein
MRKQLRSSKRTLFRAWGAVLAVSCLSIGVGVPAGLMAGWTQGVLVGCAVPVAAAGLVTFRSTSKAGKPSDDQLAERGVLQRMLKDAETAKAAESLPVRSSHPATQGTEKAD